MNCEEARDNLIDLVYGELDAPGRQAVEDHLRTCPACREEHEKLRFARAALAKGRSAEPAGAPAVPFVSPAEDRTPATHRLRFRRTLLAASAIAATVAVALLLWALSRAPIVTPALAAERPVEIRRQSVSLTILSQPSDWPGEFRQPVAQMEQRKRFAPNAPPYYGGTWPGLALVRDQRLIKFLPKGVSEVRFNGVPSAILPDSVRMRTLDAPDAMTILEQNYQFDLASAAAVLKRYIDKPVKVIFKDGVVAQAAGTLLSFDDRTLVIQPAGAGPQNVARENIRAIVFEKLPDGLLSTPTLLWRLTNQAAAQQQFEVAYLTHGLNWRADYILKLHPGRLASEPGKDTQSASTGRSEIRNQKSKIDRPSDATPLPSILDTADLVGYATVTNASGMTYEEAQLKLLAGDVNLIKPLLIDTTLFFGFEAGRPNQSGQEQFQEKSFFEYHLYTLKDRTTLRDAETKQIELVSGGGIKLTRGYVYDPQENATAARVVSEFKNSRDNGLGKPLPKGVVRLYAPDPTGEDQYCSQTQIDHTPVDEKVRLPWGYAFDVACSAKQTVNEVRGTEYRAVMQYSLRNHKDYPVTVTIIVHVPQQTYKARCELAGRVGEFPWHIREVGLVEIAVPVGANQEQVANFDYSYNTASGGGLKSSWQQP